MKELGRSVADVAPEKVLSDAYRDYLASPEWQEKRQLALDRADRRCQGCNRGGPLDVHHRTYERFGHEELGDLTVFCRDCHEAIEIVKATRRGSKPVELPKVERLCECGCGKHVKRRFAPGHQQQAKKQAKKLRREKQRSSDFVASLECECPNGGTVVRQDRCLTCGKRIPKEQRLSKQEEAHLHPSLRGRVRV